MRTQSSIIVARVVGLALCLPLCGIAGCMAGLTDGTANGAEPDLVPFSGVDDAANATIAISYRDPSTGAWTQFSSATTSANPTVNYFSTNWYNWGVAATIPAGGWVGGQSGAFAQIQNYSSAGHYLYAMEEDWTDCLQINNSDPVAFVEQCTTGTVTTVCTSDYLPFGSRRSLCPPRSLLGIRPSSAGTDRWSLPAATTTIVPTVTPETIQWRGDAISFLDVFDTATLDALGGTNVVRVFFPATRATATPNSYDPAALISSIGLPSATLPWRGTQAVRQYDRGECSFFLPWRTALESLVNPMSGAGASPIEAALQNLVVSGVGTVHVDTYSRYDLRPILHVNGQDQLRLMFNASVSGDGYGMLGTLNLGVQFQVVPRPGASGVTAIVDSSTTVVDFEPAAPAVIASAFGAPSTSAIDANIQTQIAGIVPTAIQLAVPALARLVPVRRIFERPDGIEFVLAEDSQDPNYNSFLAGAFCGTCDPASPSAGCRSGSTSTQAGLLFDLFDPPSPSDHLTFGDTP